MIFNQYKHLLKIRQFIKFRCNEICSSTRNYVSQENVKVVKKISTKSRKVAKENVSKQELKKGKDTGIETDFNNRSSQGVCLDKEAVAVESSVIQTEVTYVKEDVSQKEQSVPKTEEDICVNDFLIRNILTFPLHVSPDETEISNVESQVKKFPSVTSILQETMPLDARKRLDIWKQKMVETMGPEKFLSYQTATLNRGTRFHKALKCYLEGEDIEKISVTKEVEGCWNSVKPILADISDVKVVESDVFHPHLHYKGIIDCVASYKNRPHVIEWKQSEKVKKDLSATFDAPVQLTAYMGALPWCKKADLSEPITRGLVVVAYYDGAPAEVFQMDLDFCQSYWEQWLRRLQRYWATRSPNLKRPAC